MHGLLFTTDFLQDGIRQTHGWAASEIEFVAFRQSIQRLFQRPVDFRSLNEAQTEDELIVPVLEALGWERNFLRQQTANRSGREDVPDFLMFANSDAKDAAMAIPARQQDRRYRHGVAILEAKRWGRALDRGESSDTFDPGTPSSQMLRYLSRVEVASDRAIKWGILSNGQTWRLYWQDARSRAEEFLQFDLLSLSGVASTTGDLFSQAHAGADVHLLRAFFLLFRRQAFLPQPGDGRSFHSLALEEGRLWESKVSQDLGRRVFDDLFPKLTAALVRNDRNAARPLTSSYLEDVHRAALILLYRLLFVLYAEDRDLLPVHDHRYDSYSLRNLRQDIASRVDVGDAFSVTATRIWQHLRSLFRAIDRGDDSLGLPAYNGGLFFEAPEQILARVELPDADLWPIVDGLSRRPDVAGPAFINYRDLAVQHLGSIYERLLEQRLIETSEGGIAVKPSPLARKDSGSYYTHDDLVQLILRETLSPLATDCINAFDVSLAEAKRQENTHGIEQRVNHIIAHDPAEGLLRLRVCDPAMGSGHFLVSLVDDLADRVLVQLADAPVKALSAGIAHYQSPIVSEITRLRERILAQADQGGWAFDRALLDDRHLVRRMILKRVVHGADKNPMAVELAKLALWLHTFTVGAPLSFLDHHLRCGDSLYGERLATVRASLMKLGDLFNDSDVAGMVLAARTLSEINAINDVDLREVERSRSLMEQAYGALGGLKRVFDVWQALRWLAPLDTPARKRGERHEAASELLSGRYRRTLMEMLSGDHRLQSDDPRIDQLVNALLDDCRAFAREEGFLHWEIAFPGLWPLEGVGSGGFDAIIGNPPWDRMKLQEVEWFAERRPEIAHQGRAADRKRMITELQRAGDPVASEYAVAERRAENAARIARDCGEYPLLSGGDINLYSLFVERAAHLLKPEGMVGLLTPSGIAGDKGAAGFFRSLSTTDRLAALFDFENKKAFFPDIDSRFKFCALVFGGTSRRFQRSRCAFYLHSVAELELPAASAGLDARDQLRRTRVIELGSAEFGAVNPNTGTAPIFRNALDASLTIRLYREHPVFVSRRTETRVKGKKTIETEVAEPLFAMRYCTMFHMTNDSADFFTEAKLTDCGGYKVASNRWRTSGGDFVPLYEGKMVQAYDHRAASVAVNARNLHRPAQPEPASDIQRSDPAWLPSPQFWVALDKAREQLTTDWVLAFKHVSSPTNVRTMISAICPVAGFGNSLPLLVTEDAEVASRVQANLNSLALDYICRQKLQGQNLNLFVIEQLPLIAPARYDDRVGTGSVSDLVRREVLHLCYSAHDLADFAKCLGYDGPPFAWDVEERRHRQARLDALYFRLYGLSHDEAAYVMDTFPIMREQDEAKFGEFRTKNLVLGYMNALQAGDVDSVLYS